MADEKLVYLRYKLTLVGSSGAATATLTGLPLKGKLRSVAATMTSQHVNLIVKLDNPLTGEVYSSKTGSANYHVNPRAPIHAAADSAAISGGSTEFMLDPNYPARLVLTLGNAGDVYVIIGIVLTEYEQRNYALIEGNVPLS